MSKTKADTVIRWETKAFGQLSASELYDILRLRAEVFVVEQRCAYQDLDGVDRQAHNPHKAIVVGSGGLSVEEFLTLDLRKLFVWALHSRQVLVCQSFH